MNVKTIFLLTGLSFFKFGSGQVASKYYAIANNYLDTSILVKRQLSRLIPKYEMSSCKKNKSLLYFCPIVNFINLSEYKEANWYYYYLNFLSSVLTPFLNKKGKDEIEDFLINFKRA